MPLDELATTWQSPSQAPHRAGVSRLDQRTAKLGTAAFWQWGQVC